MRALILLLFFGNLQVMGQSKIVTERVELSGQNRLDLEFDFANLIEFKTWDKNEVVVEVEVEINDGEDNDIFVLRSSKTANTVSIEMDEDMWDKLSDRSKKKNCWETTINYQVFLPKHLVIEANTISGDYELEYFGTELNLKTISGTIDITVPNELGLDFEAKTITGEMYSDIDIEFPNGKSGLRQIVGQEVFGRINKGGRESIFESISGDIFLRKG